MGTINPPKTCLFTDYPAYNIDSSWDAMEYECLIGDIRLVIRIRRRDIPSIKNYIPEKKWILKGLLLNKIWHREEYTTIEVLEKLIESNKSVIPSTPKEKKDKILNYYFKKQKYDGELMPCKPIENTGPEFWEYLLIKNRQEAIFYLILLKNENLIETMAIPGMGILPNSVSLTASGIEYVLKLNEGEYSENCFVAMSFTDEMFKIFDEAIQPAIQDTGFIPLLISKEHLSSETTINDGIIAAIKKSRFTISDFTDNKNGVYFEAGYALGRGQKVIYTCKETDLKNVHFDTKSYQHIVWKDAADLKKKLIDKIEAFIK